MEEEGPGQRSSRGADMRQPDLILGRRQRLLEELTSETEVSRRMGVSETESQGECIFRSVSNLH